MNRYTKRLLAAGLISVVSLLTALLLMEKILAFAYPEYDPAGRIRFYCRDNGLYLMEPNRSARQWTNTGEYNVPFISNAWGFRDDKDIHKADSASWWIVGDSFSMGHGVRETRRYGELIERELNTQVYNLANPGDIRQYRKLVNYTESFGVKISKMIVGICMENDITDYRHYTSPCSRKAAPGYLTMLKAVLTANSVTYNLLSAVFQQNGMLRRAGISLGLIEPNTTFLETGSISDAAIASSVAEVDSLISGRQAVVVVIPSRGLWQGDHRQAEAKTHDAFVGALREKKIDVIDLRSEFEAGGDPLQFHFPLNGHWNEKGHAMAAKIIAGRLKQQ